jgi:hypothetical protein
MKKHEGQHKAKGVQKEGTARGKRRRKGREKKEAPFSFFFLSGCARYLKGEEREREGRGEGEGGRRIAQACGVGERGEPSG